MARNHGTLWERIARRIWLLMMTGSPGRRLFLPPYPDLLEQRHLENCRVMCHRAELLSRLDLPESPRVAEIGTFWGEFSQTILDRLRPGELHLFDLDLSTHGIAKKFELEISRRIVRLHEGNSSTHVETFSLGYFDLIYVDGDHSYEGVKNDIVASVPRLADHGYLIFNDYTYWSPCEQMPYGIMQAVNEFCRRENWEVTHFALDGYMYCDIALRRRGIAARSWQPRMDSPLSTI